MNRPYRRLANGLSFVVTLALGTSLTVGGCAPSATSEAGSDISIEYDEATNNVLNLTAEVEAAAFGMTWVADQGDDAGDKWKWNVADGGEPVCIVEGPPAVGEIAP